MAFASSSPYPDFFAIDALLTDEQKLVIQTLRSFLKNAAEPLIPECFEREEFPVSLIREMGKLGIIGANLSGYGLPGMDNIAYGLIMKELERCDSGLRSFASVQGSLVMYPIHAFGSEAQKQQWLPKLGTGEAVGCFGLTEADGGSDPGAMKTRAIDQGDHWLLNGAKMWITNGSLAQVAIVWAQTDHGIRGFVVPTETPGVTIKKMRGKLSLRASVTSELYFDQVKLPKEARLPKAEGLKAALACLTQARYGIAWGVIGAAESCFDEVVTYTKDRIVFKKPLASFQLVQKKLATLATEISQAQLLAFRLGQLKDAGQMHFVQVSMAKQANVEMALRSARTCRDMLGANGIMLEYKTMRHMCNLESVFTYEGTNDIHSLIVGQEITGIPAFG
ncbi:MAG: acyl-CoA dehydrogenase family protein [Proteobacteria bacterium]|nr:acyl-CoA dehydrogenase family protein [Pseudomonadota bacterium]